MSQSRKNSTPLEYVEYLRAVLENVRTLDLKRLRQIAGLSQEKVAHIAQVTTRTWYKWEKHLSRPNTEAIERVCREIEKKLRDS